MEYSRASFLFMAFYGILCVPKFVYPLIHWRTLGLFPQLLATFVSRAAIKKVCTCICLYVFDLLGWILMSGIQNIFWHWGSSFGRIVHVKLNRSWVGCVTCIGLQMQIAEQCPLRTETVRATPISCHHLSSLPWVLQGRWELHCQAGLPKATPWVRAAIPDILRRMRSGRSPCHKRACSGTVAK